MPDNIADYEDLDETQRDAVDKRIFRQVLSDDPAEVEKERAEVEDLLRMAESLRKGAFTCWGRPPGGTVHRNDR